MTNYEQRAISITSDIDGTLLTGEPCLETRLHADLALDSLTAYINNRKANDELQPLYIHTSMVVPYDHTVRNSRHLLWFLR